MMRIAIAGVLVLLHVAASCAFQAPSLLSNAVTRKSCIVMSSDVPSINRRQAVKFASVAAFLPLVTGSVPAVAEEAATAEPSAEEDSGQVLDVEKINGKKAAILGGAFLLADVISGLVTGRSVLRIVGGNEDPEDWKVKVVNKLLEKEKAEAAARMGVSVTTESQPSGKERGPSATGDYAKSDPFEIAKQKYKKKESIEDLQKKLRTQLTDDDDDD